MCCFALQIQINSNSEEKEELEELKREKKKKINLKVSTKFITIRPQMADKNILKHFGNGPTDQTSNQQIKHKKNVYNHVTFTDF
jgi:hypothetical protein